MIWLLIGYMYLFIHRPFEIWGWLGEWRIERIYMLLTLAYWAIAAPKKWTPNQINIGIFVFALSFFLSTLFSQYVGFGNLGIQDWLKILVFYVLVITSVNRPQDFRLLIVAFIAIAAIFELHSLREYFNGRGVSRMGTWRMIAVNSTLGDPNSLAATTNTFIPMLLPMTVFAKHRWQKLAILGLLCLFVFVILCTGSRGGFIALGCLVIGIVLYSKYRWKILPLMIILPILLWSFLPEDLQNRYRTIINPSAGPANAQASAESRTARFSGKLPRSGNDNPFLESDPMVSKWPAELANAPHSLYAQVISDLGTVGVIAFGTLILCFGFTYWQARKVYYTIDDDPWAKFHFYVILACSIGVLQLLLLGFGGHNLLRFTWIWYAAFSALGFKFLVERAGEIQALDAATDEA